MFGIYSVCFETREITVDACDRSGTVGFESIAPHCAKLGEARCCRCGNYCITHGNQITPYRVIQHSCLSQAPSFDRLLEDASPLSRQPNEPGIIIHTTARGQRRNPHENEISAFRRPHGRLCENKILKIPIDCEYSATCLSAHYYASVASK